MMSKSKDKWHFKVSPERNSSFFWFSRRLKLRNWSVLTSSLYLLRVLVSSLAVFQPARLKLKPWIFHFSQRLKRSSSEMFLKFPEWLRGVHKHSCKSFLELFRSDKRQTSSARFKSVNSYFLLLIWNIWLRLLLLTSTVSACLLLIMSSCSKGCVCLMEDKRLEQ